MKKEYTPKEIIENPILQKFLVGQTVEYYLTEFDPTDQLYVDYTNHINSHFVEEEETLYHCNVCKTMMLQCSEKCKVIPYNGAETNKKVLIEAIKQCTDNNLYFSADYLYASGKPNGFKLQHYDTSTGKADTYHSMHRVVADKLYRAACCLVVDPETNLILAVSRKTNHEQFGFPGGTVEDNETFLEGAIRELKEETGYIINDDYKPLEVHEHLVKDRHVKLFSVPLNKLTDTKERLKGEGVLKFVSWNTLLNGPFGETIQQVYNEIYKLY